jgi:trigger factor
MAITIEEKGLERVISVEEKGEKIKNLVDDVVKEISKNVSIKGFRKGHIPPSIIKARYKDAIKEEVARKYISENFEKIVEENNLKPITTEIGIQEIELKGDQLKVKFIIEVEPEFELKDYKGLEFDIVKVEVPEESIQKVLDDIRAQHYQDKGDDAVVEEKDKVRIHYKIESDKGETEEDDFEVIIGANQLRPEIEKEILGKKKGDIVVVENVPLINEKGEEFGKAKVEVKILKIEKLPELTDEFIKEIGFAENLEEAKKKIKEDIEKELKQLNEFDLDQKITDKLVELHNDIEVPQALLRAELNDVITEYSSQLERAGIKPNRDIIATALPNLEEAARKRAIAVLVINKIAENEGIKVEDEDIEAEIERMAKDMQTTPEAVKAWLQEQGLINRVIYGILRRKVLDLIKQNAKINELTKEEYDKKYNPQQVEEPQTAEQEEQTEEKEEVKEEAKEENKEEADEEKTTKKKTAKKKSTRGRKKKKKADEEENQ